MSLESAHQFVSRMKEDGEFRSVASSSPGNEVLNDYLTVQGYEFDRLELIAAMAACMADLDKMMQD
ncbi:MAG: Nif11 family protein [Deltaproteobacteria bacterium]|nr:Nif11 family protein [Deltaproteobacteria bacterium]